MKKVLFDNQSSVNPPRVPLSEIDVSHSFLILLHGVTYRYVFIDSVENNGNLKDILPGPQSQWVYKKIHALAYTGGNIVHAIADNDVQVIFFKLLKAGAAIYEFKNHYDSETFLQRTTTVTHNQVFLDSVLQEFFPIQQIMNAALVLIFSKESNLVYFPIKTVGENTWHLYSPTKGLFASSKISAMANLFTALIHWQKAGWFADGEAFICDNFEEYHKTLTSKLS